MRKKKFIRWKRCFSLSLALVLALSMDTSAVLAAEISQTTETTKTSETTETGETALISERRDASTEKDTSAAVTINDENLRKAICNALNKEYTEGVTITENEMASLTELVAENAGITDLTGLSKAVNLEKLNLGGNPIDDANRYKGSSFGSCFEEFSAYTKLKELNLSKCRLGESNYNSSRYKYNLGTPPRSVVALISSLDSLESIDLSDNGFTSAFSTTGGSSDTIKKIDLSGNGLNDFSISNYTKELYPALEEINLSDNRIYWDDVVDSYQAMLEAGVTIQHDNQKNLSELFMVVQDTGYSGKITSSAANYCYPDENNRIYLGDIVGDSTLIAFANYAKVNTSKTTIGEEKVTVANYDGIENGMKNTYSLKGLKNGLNEIPVSVMHVSGDVSEYTLVINVTSYAPQEETEDSEYVYVKDASVYNALLKSLGQTAGYKITKADLASLTSFSLPSGVTDISWLKYAINLTSLSQSNVSEIYTFTEASAIEELTQLKNLCLLSSNLEKAPDLSKLTSLTELRITPAADGSLPDCSALTGLKNFYLYRSKDGKLPSGLNAVTGMCTVYLYYTDGVEFNIKASDVPAKISNIKIYSCTDTTVRFGDMTGSNSFGIEADTSPNCRVIFDKPETTPVKSLSYNYDCGTSDVLPANLNQLPSLTSLRFYEWAGDDLVWNDGFENLKTVTSVTINQGKCNQVPKQLASMENLSSLTISSTQIEEFDVDISKTKVSSLALGVNQLKTMPKGEYLPATLQTLQIYNNKISNMDTVDYSHLTNLKTIVALGNPIYKFPTFIKSIPNLETLQIQNGKYVDIPVDAFEGMNNLKTLYIGNWLDVYVESYSYGMPNYALVEGTNAAKAIENLRATSTKFKRLEVEGGSANYSAIAEILVNGKPVEVNSEMNLTFAPGTESVEIFVRPYKDDTTITIGNQTVTGSGTVTLDLADGFNNIAIKSCNDDTNLISQTTETDYNLTIFVGNYLSADDIEEGKYYQVDCSFEKQIGGGASMAGSYFSDKAIVRMKNGKYEVYLTSNNAAWTQSIAVYGENGELVPADVISQDATANTLQVRMKLDSVDEKFLMNLYVVPMGYAPNCYVLLDLSTLVDITEQMPTVDLTDLNAVINKALEIADKNNIYTDASYTAFHKALEEAQKVADNTLSTQEEADNAKNVLEAAIDALTVDESKLANKTALKAALDEARAITKGNHTDTAWNTLQEAIADAQSIYDTLEATQSEVDTAVKSLNTAMTLFNNSGETSNLDKNNLTDGVYSVYVDMIKMDRESKSMADNVINHTVKLEVINGEYFVTLDFRGITIENRFGYLKNLSYYADGYTYGQYGTVDGTLVPAQVLSTQKDSDGKDVIDQYNDADNLYPDLVKIKLVPQALADEEGYVPLHVFVPIMEAIAAGNGDQDVLMKLDWTTLKETTADDPGFQPQEPEEQSPAVDVTDSVTGIRVTADKGVLPEGAELKVTAITSGSIYENAATILADVGKKFKLYEIHFELNGEEIQPNGTVTVGYPVPAGYNAEKLVMYRVNDDGTKTLIKGNVQNGYYNIITKHFSYYALVEKDSTITDAENTALVAANNTNTGNNGAGNSNGNGNNTGSTANGSNPKTGDSTNMAGWILLVLAAAGILVVLVVRRCKAVKGE